MKVAVIPARGGSKRIPRKNIKIFYGQPMIAWSIQAAQKSLLFDRIIVSTEDCEIAAIAKQLGAEVPFTRPEQISDDHTGTTEVIAHATQWMINAGWPVTAVCCIYATAPFIQIKDIKQGLNFLESGNWEYVFSATEFSTPIFRSFEQTSRGELQMFFPDYFLVRSQDMPRALHDAGQFYWGRPSAWLNNKRIFAQHSTCVVIPTWRVHDIDTEDDWKRAEIISKTIMNHDFKQK
ncbi:pseudaminic acid cytidylyltransferase [Leptothoe kymatousa]|uniref:Pseudaminic acid cytidylyltransferase n=1 Tax=Leptothoe kymatousa TAU-MAC 1615 TaxID=2364775 RepID=A0ABS5Y174_9CYAN|nr:pseudaminic acid cytidylyltransferase [Leptothoe kymatousa]MBT9311371.1 pseudaminic acid cytidylyltransferase [Leptothoe kymatousa TAU-MAC 1615]